MQAVLASPFSPKVPSPFEDKQRILNRQPDLAFKKIMHSRAGSTEIPGTGKNSPVNRVVVASPGIDRWRSPVGAHHDWDLSDQFVQLKIGDKADQIHTPPRRTSIASVALEASPLETSSDASSPESTEGPLGRISHNRESSADSGVRALNVPPISAPSKIGLGAEPRERPHSYSGGFSNADLKRLQLADVGGSPGSSESTPLNTKPPTNWTSPAFGDQPTYPSLSNSPTRSANSQSASPPSFASSTFAPEPETEFTPQQRQFSPIPQPPVQRATGSPGNGAFNPNRGVPINGASATTATAVPPYGQLPRAFSPQVAGMVPGPQPGFGYPPQATLQQMYEMMVPPPENPAVARIQQQHGAFRPTHAPSTSDPSSLRDAALLLANMQAFGAAAPGAGVYPPQPPAPSIPMYGAAGFYPTGPQDIYAPAADLAQLMAAARLQQQQQQQTYVNQYGLPIPAQQQMPIPGLSQAAVQQLAGLEAAANGAGPSANNRKLGLYKTELCRSWEEKGTCRYGAKCQFAHGEEELRTVSRHPKYKTEICRTFWVSGSCPYGKRCCFIHTELPAGGAPPGADGTPPPTNLSPGGRSRSASTNSEPADASSTSLLARITAKRNQGPSAGASGGSPSLTATPIDTTPQASSFPINSRPGALRVDTSTIPNSNIKENKSAYPAFQQAGIIHSTVQESPIAVTAHPDFARQRIDLSAQPGSRLGKSVASPNNRHSFNGTDLSLDFNNPPAGLSSLATPIQTTPTASIGRASGHMRSGSAGNWNQVTRPSRLGPYSSIPGNEIKPSPWASSELAMGAARHS